MIQQMISGLKGIPRLAGNLRGEVIEGFNLGRMNQGVKIDPDIRQALSNANTAGLIASNPYAQGAAGLAALGTGGVIVTNMLNGEEDRQYVIAPNQPPTSMSQQPPQVGIETLTPLNEEQVKKAQKRAQEQAALNAFYAQQLGQYPGGQE